MPDYFRIIRGLEIDESIRILQGAGIPGNTADTDNAPVGSMYMDNTNGVAYSKFIPGPTFSTWQPISAQGLSLYSENPVSPGASSPLGANSVTIGNTTQTTLNAPNSLAIGEQSVARLTGGFVQANGRFGSSGDAQVGRYILRTITTNNIPTQAFLDGVSGTKQLTLQDDSTWMFKATVVGHRVDLDDGHAGYTIEGVVYRQSGASTISLLGKPVINTIAESNSAWETYVSVDVSTGSLRLYVVGETAKIIRWMALVETTEISN